MKAITTALACLFAHCAFTPVAHPGVTYRTPTTTITEKP